LCGELGGVVRAVVVADEDVAVDIAEADPVVGVFVAAVDARFVAGDARVYDAGGVLVARAGR
jgi:hypothetical protein